LHPRFQGLIFDGLTKRYSVIPSKIAAQKGPWTLSDICPKKPVNRLSSRDGEKSKREKSKREKSKREKSKREKSKREKREKREREGRGDAKSQPYSTCTSLAHFNLSQFVLGPSSRL